MKFGLCTISGADRPIGEVVDLAASAGYDGIEVWGKDHIGDRSPERCRSIADAVAERSLSIPVYGSYLRPGTDEYEADRDRELAAAQRLGADLVRVWAGRQEYGAHDDGHWDRVVGDLADLTDAAADAGLGVTVERHEGTLTNRTEGARRLIEAVDRERCRLNWQPAFDLHADALAADAAELAPLSNNIHLQAVPACGADERCSLADAYFDVERVLRPFVERDFDGFANVEFVGPDRDYAEAIESNLAYLRSLY